MWRYLNPFHYIKKRPLLGLDLAADEIRLLQINKSEQGFHLEKLACQAVSQEAVMEGKVRNYATFKKELRHLVLRTETTGYSAAIALSNHAVFRKNLQFPVHYKEEEIMTEIDQQFHQYFPGVLSNEMHIDFVIQRVTDNAQYVLLAAARKSYIQKMVEAVAFAGLKVSIIDLDVYAWARSVLLLAAHADEDKATQVYALLEMQESCCNFIVFKADDLIFHHPWVMDKTIFASPLDFLPLWLQQIKRAWQSCLTAHPECRIHFMAIGGTIEHIHTLAAHIEAELSIPAACFNPFSAMIQGEDIDAALMREIYPRFLLSCGLAMRILPK